MPDDVEQDEASVRGIAQDWIDLYLVEGGDARLARAMGLSYPPIGGDEAALAVANDLGLAVADVVAVDAASRAPRKGEEIAVDTARQWRFAAAGESGSFEALILPVAIDYDRPAYAPGQATLSIARLDDELFVDSICDLVALPVAVRSVPLSLTGLSLAVGRFQPRERGEVEIYATAGAWLKSHMDRARDMESELPAHLVAAQLEQPEHYSTLVLEPKAIEWRPHIAWCPLPSGTKSVIVRDSLGLANAIGEAMARKLKLPPLPKVFGPKAGVA